MPDKNFNSDCRFSADIVSYLYDEIETREKSVFETHLKSCSKCAGELADFSFASFAIKDWRNEEFSPLNTPSFDIPFDVKQTNEPTATNSTSLFDNLRRFFSLRPVWATGAAALIVMIGLAFAANNLMQPDFTAKNDGVNSASIAVSPAEESVGQTVNQLTAESEDVPVSKPLPPTIKKNATEKPATAQKSSAAEIRSSSNIKTADRALSNKNAIKTVENTAASNVKNFDKQIANDATPINRQIPTLDSFEEDNDNTLRLAELFEDVDTGK